MIKVDARAAAEDSSLSDYDVCLAFALQAVADAVGDDDAAAALVAGRELVAVMEYGARNVQELPDLETV